MIARHIIEHAIEFVYSAPVQVSVMTLYLHPVQDRRQVVRGFTIETDPSGSVFEFEGPFHNRGHFFDRPGRHRRLSIVGRSTVEVGPIPETPREVGEDAWARLEDAARAPELGLMLQPSRFVRPSPLLADFIASCGLERGDDPLATATALRSRLHESFDYIPGTTAVDSPIERIIESREGVCQDYAHVMASILRSWGVPTRYASGYLGPDGPDESHSQSHAWVESWLPGIGWRGFDPTNDCDCNERHILVAVGRDYADVPPVRGTFRGNTDSTLSTNVSVTPEEPNATFS